MRFILWMGLVLGLLWGSYWFVGSVAIENGVTQWFADSQAQGLTAENEGIAVSGFPSRFDLTVTNPRLADPILGIGWKAPFAQVLSMTWKPWHVIAVLPMDQEIEAAGRRIAVTTSKMAASLRLKPSTNLTFQELVIEAHDLALTSDLGWKSGVKAMVLALADERSATFSARLGLDVMDLRPDPQLTGRLRRLGDVVRQIHLDASLGLSAGLDRHIAETRPQITQLTVHDFKLTWGKLQLKAKGKIEPDLDGLAQGMIDFEITSWQEIPELAVALELIRPEMAASLMDGFRTLIKPGADPDVLNLPLTFSNGWMTLGPLPLGPAPMLN